MKALKNRTQLGSLPDGGAVVLFLSFLVVVALPAPECNGSAEPYVGIEELLTKSTLVVAGTVTEINEVTDTSSLRESGYSLRKITVYLSNDVVLQGTNANNPTIIYCELRESPNSAGPEIEPQKGESVLAFLVAKDGRYAFTNPWRPYVHLSSSVITVARGGAVDLEGLLLRCLEDPAARVVREAMTLLDQMRSQKALPKIDALTKSADPAIAGAALAFTLKLGKGDHLADALKYLDSAPNNPAKSDVVGHIGDVKDKNCLPLLHKLLADKQAELRRSAIMAIRNLQSEESIPFVINCLDDQDDTVRYMSLLTLNAILGPCEVGGEIVSYTRQDYGKALQAQKDWWNTEGKQRYSLPQ